MLHGRYVQRERCVVEYIHNTSYARTHKNRTFTTKGKSLFIRRDDLGVGRVCFGPPCRRCRGEPAYVAARGRPLFRCNLRASWSFKLEQCQVLRRQHIRLSFLHSTGNVLLLWRARNNADYCWRNISAYVGFKAAKTPLGQHHNAYIGATLCSIIGSV